jgi:hypothetical protein
MTTATPAPVATISEPSAVAHLFEARRIAAKQHSDCLYDVLNLVIKANRLGKLADVLVALEEIGGDR